MITISEIGNFAKNEIDIRTLLLVCAVSIVVGLFILLTYYLTHKKNPARKMFNASLTATSVVAAIAVYAARTTAAVIIAIVVVGVGSAMRIAITKDEEDERFFMLWASAAGICVGTGEFMAAAILCVIMFIIFIVFGLVIKNDACLIIIKGIKDRELDTEGLIFRMLKRKAKLKTKTTVRDNFELIYEVPASVLLKMEKSRINISDSIMELGGIESVRVLSEAEDNEK